MRRRDFMRSMAAVAGTALSRPRCAAWRKSSAEFREISESACHARYAQWVRPLIGTGWHGHTFPGATMPFGLVQLSPDTQGPPRAWYDWDHSGGYHSCDRVITGFSHTHIQGTGAPELGDVLLMPVVKGHNWAWERGTPLTRSWLAHLEIAAGGELIFRVSSKPNREWAVSAADRPPSGLIPAVAMPSSRGPGKCLDSQRC